VLGFVVLGVLTLPRYGLTWDEGLGDLFVGERYWHYFTTADPAYLDFSRSDLAIHERPFNLFRSPFRHLAHQFPPLANTLSAGAMELLAHRLGWLDPVDAFHLPKVVLCGVLLWVLFEFARRRLGPWTAALAVALLGSYPRFWGDMHFNPKDHPETVFFSLTIVAYCAWRARPTVARAAASGVLWGCALAVKANALFVPVVLLLAGVPWRTRPAPWSGAWTHAKRYLGHYALMGAAGLAVHLGTWPLFHAEPVRLLKYYRYISARARQGTEGGNWDALVQTFTTMPETIIPLFLLGIVLAIRLRRTAEGPTLRLLVVWAAVPILRTSLPGSLNFDGIRHFQEFLPPACLLAAFAAKFLVARVADRAPKLRRAPVAALLLLLGGNIGWAVARYTPYEHIYFNSLVGGLAGAQREHGMAEATDYWASSYRQGMRWLNAAAPPNAALHVPVAPWLVELTAPIWLRPDIAVVPAEETRATLHASRPLYIMFITRAGFYTPIARLCVETLPPVHEIRVAGLPVLQIYRLGDPPDPDNDAARHLHRVQPKGASLAAFPRSPSARAAAGRRSAAVRRQKPRGDLGT